MTRSMLVAFLSFCALFVAPHGSIWAIEMVENVDGGTALMSPTTELDVPSTQPDVVSLVPEPAPRSSSTPPPAVPESFGFKGTAPTSTGSA